MEKQCELCKKFYQTKTNKQKYCSVECQHESYRQPKVEKKERICLQCGVIFFKIPSKSNEKYGKYCTRKCKDTHQKEIYIGEKNPAWGRKSTLLEKEIRSDLMKELWKSQEFRESIKKSQKDFLLENGYWPGSDEKSGEKRKKTMFEKYGITHNWNGKYGERKCDINTLKKHGKMGVDFLIDYSFYYGKKTDIEKIFETYLIELGIKYTTKFRIYDKEKINFWYREYDFLINDTNILIETDGDYWHGNKEIFKKLSKIQKETIEKDKIKEIFANKNGFKVIRFWGNDIKNKKELVLKKIKEQCKKLN